MKNIFAAVFFIACCFVATSCRQTPPTPEAPSKSTAEYQSQDGALISKDFFDKILERGEHTTDTLHDKAANKLIVKLVAKQPAATTTSTPQSGAPALPAINGTTLSGQAFNTATLKDKVIVTNFWFTACRPCIQEMPDLNKLYQKYQANPNVAFVALSTDDKERTTKFLTKKEFKYPIIADAANQATAFSVSDFPTNMIIKNDKVLLRMEGYSPKIFDELDKVIQEGLK